ncbi:MAG TPA: CocE/NonD family hydrolase [Alphaproteobacteria bacterium]|nr:CocE/NonD family hydrolase [Alphaproteobacteria bacterium]
MKRRITAVLFAFVLMGSAVVAQPTTSQVLSGKEAQASTAAGIEGIWSGTLEAGGQKLRLALKVTRAADGKLSATLDSLDQGATGIPVSSVQQTGDDVKVELAGISAAFQGKLNAARSEMQGDWKQGGNSFPLTLHRAEAGTSEKPKEPKGLPATLAGFSDEAAFALVLNEEQVGTMKSTWTTDGSVDTQVTVSLGGQTVKATNRIIPGPDGRWAQVIIESPALTITLVREGSSVKRTIKDKTTTWETREGVLLFDNNVPMLISQGIRAYDRVKGGVQKFPLLVLPGTAADLSLEAKEKLERTVGGKDLSLTKFIYSLPGVDLEVLADVAGKVYLVELRSQKAAFVREGYASLRRAEAADPLLSAPKYEVEVERAVGVPMRDGVKLATDIYRPKGVEKAPVILVRTPYKKDMGELQAKFYARRGYIFAIQDCRGRFGSPGVWEPFVNEPHDGYDAVEWLARQPFSSGKVGMIGGSYLGWVQWWAASERPPHLATIIPNVAPPDPFHNVPYEYGAFFLWGAIWWADILESEATADLSGVALTKIGEKKYLKLLRALPVIDLDKSVLGKENPYWRKWIQHPTNDAYWQPANFLDHDRLKDVNIPVFHQSGWFDGDGIGTKLNYLAMASYKHENQKLTLGPWGHTDTAGRIIGDHDFGEQAVIDLQRDYLRWFDHWLKGVDNGVQKEPLVSLFVMGSNKWLHGEKYPLEVTRFQKLYLASGGKANTAKGDGKLTFDVPLADAPPDHYTYDPGDPTPDPRFYEESEENEKKVRSVGERKKEREGYYQKITEERNDLLVYMTDPLAKPLTFAGPVSAVLYASSSARDTDWFMSLSEVDKDGKIFPLVQGKIRARFRKSMTAPEMLKRNEVYEYALDLWHTGITIPAGSRLRVDVASAAFPLFSRNLNTGGHNETETSYVTAQQAIYHNQKYPSHLLLPCIPE